MLHKNTSMNRKGGQIFMLKDYRYLFLIAIHIIAAVLPEHVINSSQTHYGTLKMLDKIYD